jgi:hypothetical protein
MAFARSFIEFPQEFLDKGVDLVLFLFYFVEFETYASKNLPFMDFICVDVEKPPSIGIQYVGEYIED